MELIQVSVVVVADGFTPQVLHGKALEAVFRRPPAGHLSTPLVTTADFDDGFTLSVQPDRIEVRQRNPGAFTSDLSAATRRLLGLWPLVEARAIGLNFMLSRPFDAQFTMDRAFAFVARSKVESVFRGKLSAERHAFSFSSHGAKVTLNVGDGKVGDGPRSAVVDCNVNFDRPSNISAVLRSGAVWLARATEWGTQIVSVH